MHKAAPCSMSEILCNRHHLENYVILYVAVLYSSLFLRKKRIWKKKKKKKKHAREWFQCWTETLKGKQGCERLAFIFHGVIHQTLSFSGFAKIFTEFKELVWAMFVFIKLPATKQIDVCRKSSFKSIIAFLKCILLRLLSRGLRRCFFFLFFLWYSYRGIITTQSKGLINKLSYYGTCGNKFHYKKRIILKSPCDSTKVDIMRQNSNWWTQSNTEYVTQNSAKKVSW